MAFLSTVRRLLNYGSNSSSSSIIIGSQFSSIRLCSTFTSPKIYICGLPRNTTDKKLRKVFSHFGEIVEAKFEIDEATGKATGLGTITYAATEEAEAAKRAMSGSCLF